MIPAAAFDYSRLDSRIASAARESAASIRKLNECAKMAVVEIGKHLIEMKEVLGHGNFLPWIESEFRWSERAARNFMQVAEAFKSAKFADLAIDTSALYVLAAPSTPEPVRAQMIERAEAGERITHSMARSAVNSAKAAPSYSGAEPSHFSRIQPRPTYPSAPPALNNSGQSRVIEYVPAPRAPEPTPVFHQPVPAADPKPAYVLSKEQVKTIMGKKLTDDQENIGYEIEVSAERVRDCALSTSQIAEALKEMQVDLALVRSSMRRLNEILEYCDAH